MAIRLITLMLMKSLLWVHKNPNFVVACLIIIFVVVFVAFTNTSQKHEPGGKTISIKQLGIKVDLPVSLKQLSYASANKTFAPTEPTKPVVTINIQNFTELANQCTGLTNKSYIFKTLVKLDGQAGKKSGVKLAKQLKNYYVLSLDSGLPTNDACSKSKLHPQLKSLYNKLNGQLDTALRSSKPL